MYSKSENYVTYFVDENARNTDKMFCGKVSEAIKVGEENGKGKYDFELWNAKFVGKAKQKAEKLSDKSSIKLTEWSARISYNKEKKSSYPYLLVMDFEEKGAEK